MAEQNATNQILATNLHMLRKKNRFSQEDLAEQIGVTRQAVAKWENGDSLPDIINCNALADLFGVSLNDLVRFDPVKQGMPIPPRDKHIFGLVTINEKGQIVLPKKARDALGYKPGDTLMVLGDTSPGMPGLALMDSKQFLQIDGLNVEPSKLFAEPTRTGE